jgi:hypothetical protein
MVERLWCMAEEIDHLYLVSLVFWLPWNQKPCPSIAELWDAYSAPPSDTRISSSILVGTKITVGSMCSFTVYL